jgi:hexosaminidase
MNRIGQFIGARGRKVIGWDEILEGGAPPQVMVMSWRGFEGGIEAARLGLPVVMCPSSHCYFDHYQGDPEYQPEAIGGMTTLKKVYSFQPVPSELNTAQRKYILGGQGNLWTEYVASPDHAEFMALPRMTALAEVLWTPDGLREWYGFRERLQTQFARFDHMGARYFPGSGKVEVTPVFHLKNAPYAVKLETEAYGTEIFYTLDNREPGPQGFPYKEPFGVSQSVTLKAIAFKDNQKLERFSSQQISIHEGINRSVTYSTAFSERYPAGGQRALVDGLKGTLHYNDDMWQGFNGVNLDLVIAFDSAIVLNSINASFLLDQQRWIFLPERVNFYFSEDGISFTRIASGTHKIDQQQLVPLINDFRISIGRPLKVNYIRVEAVNMGTCPDWHPGKGGKAWIFADEIVIN